MIQALLISISMAANWGGPLERSSQGAYGYTGTKHYEATCRVHALDGRGWSVGSGAYIGADESGARGVIVTAAHVVKGTTGRGKVEFPVSGEKFDFEVFQQDPGNDVAVLVTRGRPRAIEPFIIADRDIKLGEYTTMAGYGGEHRRGFFVTYGKATTPLGGEWPMIEVDTIVSGGDSGGPVFTNEGQWAGVISTCEIDCTGGVCRPGRGAGVACFRRGILGRLLPPWIKLRRPAPKPSPEPEASQPQQAETPSQASPAPAQPGDAQASALQAKIDQLQQLLDQLQQTRPSTAPIETQPSTAPDVPKRKPFDWGALAGPGLLIASGAAGVGIPAWAFTAWRAARRIRRLRHAAAHVPVEVTTRTEEPSQTRVVQQETRVPRYMQFTDNSAAEAYKEAIARVAEFSGNKGLAKHIYGVAEQLLHGRDVAQRTTDKRPDLHLGWSDPE